jgi:hypothetical protein
MKAISIKIYLFLIVVIVQLAVPSMMILNYENILNNGKIYKFELVTLIPKDTFRNKSPYIYFKESAFKNDTTKKWKRGEEIYVWIAKNSTDNFIQFNKISREFPNSIDFIKANISSIKDDSIALSFPFDKYIEVEPNLSKIKTLFKSSSTDSTFKCYALVSIINGTALISDVVFNNKPIKEIK